MISADLLAICLTLKFREKLTLLNKTKDNQIHSACLENNLDLEQHSISLTHYPYGG